MQHANEKQRLRWGLRPKTWRMLGYARDAFMILAILLAAMYFREHPGKFDTLLNGLISYRHRHEAAF
jgi:hypothetical protein